MAVKVPLVRDSTTNLPIELSASDTIAKASVGLGNVDNTSDADKPVSTDTQTALNAKADKATTLSGYGITDAVAEKGQVTNLDTLAGSCAFGFTNTATGAPSIGGNYDATGMQWAETGQTTQLVSLATGKGAQLLIRVDDGGGFSSWSAVLTDLNSGDFATADQGVKADSALQPDTNVTVSRVTVSASGESGLVLLSTTGGRNVRLIQSASGNVGFYDAAASRYILLISTDDSVSFRGPLSVPSVTPGSGKKLSKITLSSSAPGTLADGELYLRF